MEYSNYSVEDFAVDDLFIKWVVENDPEAECFWTDVLSRNPSLIPTAEQARILLLNLQRAKQTPRDEVQLDRMWEAITEGADLNEYKRKRSYFRYAAAISVVLLASVGLWYSGSKNPVKIEPVAQADYKNEFTEHYNETESPLSIALADGSEVVLEPKSRLRYRENFSFDTVRRVFLEGEAFFKVFRNPQRPFIVFSNEVVTKVLGTSFRVRAFEDQDNILVSVSEGKVSVYSARSMAETRESEGFGSAKKGVILTSNQQVSYDRSGDAFDKSIIDRPQVIREAFVRQDFAFHNTPIKEVFQTLEKAYGVEIIFQEDVMVNCYLTVSLRDESLFEKLKIICRTLGASYELIDAKVIIDSKGCP